MKRETDSLWSHTWLLLLVLAAVTFAVYFPILHHDFIFWDDDGLVFQNPIVTAPLSPATVAQAFTSYDPQLYVPLTIVSYQIEHAIIALDPMLYHFDNLLLHILCCCLVFLLLERLGLRRATAFGAALIFALHPLNTEAVAWVSARKDLLAAAFGLASILAYLRSQKNSSRSWYVFSILLFLLGLLSKISIVLLPLAVLATDWQHRGTLTKKDRMRIIPFFFLSIVLGIVALLGKTNVFPALTWLQIILLSAKSTATGALHFLFPLWLSPVYYQAQPISLFAPGFLASLLFAAGLVCVASRILRKNRTVCMGLVFFLLFLLPSFANFSRAGEIYFTSDRYFYLPLVGLLLVAGSLFDRALRREHERIVQRPGSALLLVVLVLFGFLTIRQSKVWQNSDTFYAAAIAENPQSAALHYNRGLLWQQHGEMHMALAEYTLALQYNPLLAKAHNNVGAIFWTMQMNIAAKNEYLQALALDPAYAEAHDNLGLALMRLERYEAAKQEFQRALALAPSDAQAQANLDETEARLERQ